MVVRGSSDLKIKIHIEIKTKVNTKTRTLFVASLLLICGIGVGCNGIDDPAAKIPPTVASEEPPSSSAGSCPNTIVTVSFSKAMNASTIDGTTFTLAGPGPAEVAGVVSYAADSDTATFAPLTSLALSTGYTATISTGAMDTFGNAMVADFVWSFTTAARACIAGPPTVILGAAQWKFRHLS